MDPNGSKQIQLGAKGSVWVQIGPNKMGSKSPNKYQTGQNGIFFLLYIGQKLSKIRMLKITQKLSKMLKLVFSGLKSIIHTGQICSDIILYDMI